MICNCNKSKCLWVQRDIFKYLVVFFPESKHIHYNVKTVKKRIRLFYLTYTVYRHNPRRPQRRGRGRRSPPISIDLLKLFNVSFPRSRSSICEHPLLSWFTQQRFLSLICPYSMTDPWSDHLTLSRHSAVIPTSPGGNSGTGKYIFTLWWLDPQS